MFVINRNEDAEYPLTVDLKGFEGYKPVDALELHTDNLDDKNTFENENVLVPQNIENYRFESGELKLYVKPLSWNVLVFENGDE